MIRGVGVGTRPGNTPDCGPVLLTPYGTRNSRSRTRTSSASPGAPLDVNRSRQNMHSQALGMRHLCVDVLGVLKYILRLDAGSTEKRDRIVLGQQTLVRHGVDPHRRTGLDAQRRRHAGRQISPDNGIRTRTQCDVRLDCRRRRLPRRRRHKGRHADRGPPDHRQTANLPQHWIDPLQQNLRTA